MYFRCSRNHYLHARPAWGVSILLLDVLFISTMHFYSACLLNIISPFRYEDSDGKEVNLQIALEETIGRQMGTFISCIPGKLAYFEDEDGRYILERKS
jgi:hypothetical protein